MKQREIGGLWLLIGLFCGIKSQLHEYCMSA